MTSMIRAETALSDMFSVVTGVCGQKENKFALMNIDSMILAVDKLFTSDVLFSNAFCCYFVCWKSSLHLTHFSSPLDWYRGYRLRRKSKKVSALITKNIHALICDIHHIL